MAFRNLVLLCGLTVLNLCAVATFYVNSDVEVVWDQIISDQEGDQDPGRNERSTPREFVLPSTAAVAEAQESKHLELAGIDQVRCFQILRSRGYEIVSDALSHNVDLSRALVAEQRILKLEVTGRLNVVTAEALGCLGGKGNDG